MSSYHIWSIGCQMNKAYADQLATDLGQLGYECSETVDDADLVVVNTCVVRQSAENRALSKLNTLKPFKAARPDAVVALAGCMVDDDIDALRRCFPHVDLFLKPGESAELVEMAKSRASDGRLSVTPPAYEMNPLRSLLLSRDAITCVPTVLFLTVGAMSAAAL
jgi:tRNA-2-methylthio-N6-dimethylallyladenosine synthase